MIGSVTVDSFADAEADPVVRALYRALPATLVDLISDRVTRCLQVLGNKADGS